MLDAAVQRHRQRSDIRDRTNPAADALPADTRLALRASPLETFDDDLPEHLLANSTSNAELQHTP